MDNIIVKIYIELVSFDDGMGSIDVALSAGKSASAYKIASAKRKNEKFSSNFIKNQSEKKFFFLPGS